MKRKYLLTMCLVALLGVTSLAAAGGDARLVDAVKNRDLVNMRSLLKQRIDVNAADAEGMTALHWAAHWGDLGTVKLLISAGANAKAANRYGVTPLHEASTIGNAAGCVDADAGRKQLLLDLRKSSQMIVALDQAAVLWANQQPTIIPGHSYKRVTVLRKKG